MKQYIYNGKTYSSEYAVRKAIWKNEYKIFGSPETVEDWAALGVVLTVTEPVVTEPTLEQLKGEKLSRLESLFNQYRESNDTYVVSSLGFKANANVTAFDNVSGLVAQLQYKVERGEDNPQVGFMTFDDELVQLNLAQMKTLQVEISQNGSNIYGQKWVLRQTIKAAESKEVLDTIEIVFTHTNFSVEA